MAFGMHKKHFTPPIYSSLLKMRQNIIHTQIILGWLHQALWKASAVSQAGTINVNPLRDEMAITHKVYYANKHRSASDTNPSTHSAHSG